jgi:hypothetical protein
MVGIKNTTGRIIFEGDVHLVNDIKELFIETQAQLDEEGNLGKYDIDNLLEDCIHEQITKTKQSLTTASEVKDFNKTYKLHPR